MKRVIAIIMVMAMSLLIVGCGKDEPKGKTEKKETVSTILDKDGNAVSVDVDVSDGWKADFTDDTVYLFDGTDDDAVAICYTLEKSVYEDFVSEAEYESNYAQNNGITSYTAEDGAMMRLFEVGDKAYFLVDVVSGGDEREVMSRLEVNPVK